MWIDVDTIVQFKQELGTIVGHILDIRILCETDKPFDFARPFSGINGINFHTSTGCTRSTGICFEKLFNSVMSGL